MKLPMKTFHYVASYLLKGYAMESAGIAEKYRASSYKSLKGKIPVLSDILIYSYGNVYNQIANRAITHSFATKLRKLVKGDEVEITFSDIAGTKKKYSFTEEERLSFVLFGILYASRCNNFHGNVAARMNSINANKETFEMYTDIFLTEYIILAIHMHSQGILSDAALDKVKKNVELMI